MSDKPRHQFSLVNLLAACVIAGLLIGLLYAKERNWALQTKVAQLKEELSRYMSESVV